MMEQKATESCYYCDATEKMYDIWLFPIPGGDGEMCCERCEDRHVPCNHCRRAPCGCDDIYEQWRDRQLDDYDLEADMARDYGDDY